MAYKIDFKTFVFIENLENYWNHCENVREGAWSKLHNTFNSGIWSMIHRLRQTIIFSNQLISG